MSTLIENHLPVVRHHGLNSNIAVVFGSTLAVTGAITATGGLGAGTVLTTPVIGAATGTSLSVTGALTGNSGGGNTAGGNLNPSLAMGTSAIGIYFGDGAPTISAIKGSLYLNFTGATTATRLYINNGTTTWVAITTAS